jgi:hypothetical protein
LARILILEHALQRGQRMNYLVHRLARRWLDHGHLVRIHYGTRGVPDADIAIMNVDVTVIPDEYLALVPRFPKVINGAARDISKRRISRLLLNRDSDYAGAVIVKTNANCAGRVDNYLRKTAQERGLQCAIPPTPVLNRYPIYSSLAEVPDKVWRNSALVVEQFVPERDEHGFYSRHWLFLGDRERSVRYRAAVPIIKSHDMIDREATEVPEEIRLWRSELGLDFGKIDYVLHDGRYELLDANRSPTSPAQSGPDVDERENFLAQGIESFLREPVTS